MTIAFPDAAVFGPVQGTLVFGERITRNSGYFGIYDQSGKPVQDSDVVSGGYTTRFDPEADLSGPVQTIEGPCLFAGIATEQFGHVLLNCLGRLWALDQLPPETTLIFTSKRSPDAPRYPHVRTVLDALGIRNAFRILQERTSFTRLYTATDQFGERYDGRGSQFFYDWLDRRLPPNRTALGGKKLYVGRSGLGPRAGRFACEAALEALLQAEGYETFQPERHGLLEQFAKYDIATKIIFAEGSALHAFALRRRPDQQVAVIQRRAALPPLIETQMNDRAGPAVTVVNAIDQIYWPPVRGDHYSVATLDFGRLKSALQASGFINGDENWSAPGREAQTASLEAGLTPGQKMHDAKEREAFLRHLRRRRRARRTGVAG